MPEWRASARDSGVLLDRDFVRKKERRGAILELHQVHLASEVNQFAQDPGMFSETGAALLVTHRL